MNFLKKHKKSGEKCPRTRDRKATESALLLAGARLFAQKGYENTRTLDIAKEAGVNEALILRYFGGKEGLLGAIFKDEEGLQALINMKHGAVCADHEMFPAAAEKKQSLKDAVKTYYKNAVAMVDIKEPYMRISTSRALVDDETARMMRAKLIERQNGFLVESLQKFFDAQGKKIKPKEMEAVVTLLSSTNYVMNFMARKVYKVDPERIDNASDFMAELLEHYFKDR